MPDQDAGASREASKFRHLMHLEAWAKDRFEPKAWPTLEFRQALEEYVLYKWSTSDSYASNLARIIQIRLTKKMPAPIKKDSPPVVSEGQSILALVTANRKNFPEEYSVPKTEIKEVTEKDGFLNGNERRS